MPLALIIAKPSIYPDQPWAGRRMVPFALRGALLLATAAAAWAVERARALGVRAARAVLAIAPVALLLPAAATSGRVARFQDYAGLQRPIDAVCSAVPADAALLVLDDNEPPHRPSRGSHELGRRTRLRAAPRRGRAHADGGVAGARARAVGGRGDRRGPAAVRLRARRPRRR